MEKASDALDFERAAIYRDRLAALSAVQAHQGINPRGVEEADVFAVHQEGGFTCVEVFFFRTGQNWGNRAYFPKADRSLRAGRGAGRVPRAVLRRQAVPAAASWSRTRSRSARCWPRRSPPRAATRSRSRAAARREEGTGRPRARQCARGAGAQARRHLVAAQTARGAGRNASACRACRGASRSTTTATSRARMRSAP